MDLEDIREIISSSTAEYAERRIPPRPKTLGGIPMRKYSKITKAILPLIEKWVVSTINIFGPTSANMNSFRFWVDCFHCELSLCMEKREFFGRACSEDELDWFASYAINVYWLPIQELLRRHSEERANSTAEKSEDLKEVESEFFPMKIPRRRNYWKIRRAFFLEDMEKDMEGWEFADEMAKLQQADEAPRQWTSRPNTP